MNRSRAAVQVLAGGVLLVGLAAVPSAPVAGQGAAAKAATPSDPLLAGFARSTVASVSDAVDQVVGRRGYLAHDVRPYVAGRFVGRAATAIVKPAPPEQATPTLAVKHSVEMIDAAEPGDVGVIVMEGSLDVAAIGGLMGTAAKARGMAGMVLDGAVRDVPELRALNLPVYARAVSPATAVSRYASVAKQVPVECAGVTVSPGDIVVAGEDGVVVVPQDRAADVLKRAQEIDERETKMVPFIKKYRSLQKAIEVFNRI
ncbi:MAG TPA: RraA family protein [Vicinamibacterales bacterium]|nr:RraA family protein [Vicinamibacterales bacterium]